MAEALLRHAACDRFESFSAGAEPAGYVHPLAVEVMGEMDIDISAQRSKSVREFLPPQGEPPAVVISVCDSAARQCPAFPGDVERIDWSFDDPARAEGSDDQRRAVFRRVRDEIRDALRQWLEEPGSEKQVR